MTIDELKKAQGLVDTLNAEERLLATYRQVDEVVVGMNDKNSHPAARFQLLNQVILTADEIGDAVIVVLERRIAAMKAQLGALGVE